MSIQVTSTTRTSDEMHAAFGITPPPPNPESAPAPATTAFAGSIEVDADAEPVVPKDEPPPEPAPEPPAQKDDDADEGELDPEPEPEKAPEPPKPGEPRKVSRAQQRVNDALREKYLAEGRATQLQAELDALKAGTKPPEPVAPHDPPVAETTGDPEPKEDDFTDWSEYQLALAKWSGRQAARELLAEERQKDAEKQNAERAQTARQQAFEAYRGRAAAVREVYADFDAVVGQDLALDPAGVMQGVIVTSEVGPEIAYHLGQHPDECAFLAKADPGTILTRLHRLEGRLDALREAKRAPAPTPPTTRIPTAPPPPPAIRTGSSVDLPSTRTARTFAEFEAAERREAEARAKTR